MATGLKRYTISITPELEDELDKLKQERYYKSTQTAMIRDLIIRGLESVSKEKATQTRADQHENTP